MYVCMYYYYDILEIVLRLDNYCRIVIFKLIFDKEGKVTYHILNKNYFHYTIEQTHTHTQTHTYTFTCKHKHVQTHTNTTIVKHCIYVHVHDI